MSSILTDKKGGPMLLLGAALVFGGLFWVVRGAAIGGALVVVGLVVEVTGPYLHDRSHRRHGEEPHAMWGDRDRNKPRWLQR